MTVTINSTRVKRIMMGGPQAITTAFCGDHANSPTAAGIKATRPCQLSSPRSTVSSTLLLAASAHESNSEA